MLLDQLPEIAEVDKCAHDHRRIGFQIHIFQIFRCTLSFPMLSWDSLSSQSSILGKIIVVHMLCQVYLCHSFSNRDITLDRQLTERIVSWPSRSVLLKCYQHLIYGAVSGQRMMTLYAQSVWLYDLRNRNRNVDQIELPVASRRAFLHFRILCYVKRLFRFFQHRLSLLGVSLHKFSP